MLHEVLLALSGHPSPLFSDNARQDGADKLNDAFPLLSQSEKALLASIGRLSELHRKLRRHLDVIASNHSSMVCRSVANSIGQVHLARFQKHILDVESKILSEDASVVGAYNIVPLAAVVSEFDDWQRRMTWYWEIACFVRQPSQIKSTQFIPDASGAELVDKLRADAQTGYTDIEKVAAELSRVAETSWLRQLSSWILHGKLPDLGKEDFFVQAQKDGDGSAVQFVKNKNLLPKFVSTTTANSMFFIGKSLHQVRHYRQLVQHPTHNRDHLSSEAELASIHLKHISSIAVPILPAQLNRAIAAIRLSLSRNVLQQLLPLQSTVRLLSCLRGYFLLDEGEFAVALIGEAETRLQLRQQNMSKLLQDDPVKALRGLAIKDAELGQALAQTWKALSNKHEEEEDSPKDFARAHITLSGSQQSESRPSTSDSVTATAPQVSPIVFNDLLFPSTTYLGLDIPAPLDLFVTPREIETYSAINAYLLGIRRGHLRLADLWRRTPARRTHPAPPGPRYSSSEDGRRKLNDARARTAQRAAATRKVWATCSAAIFLLSETAAYLEGEIIKSSWDHFEAWIKQPASGTLFEDPKTQDDEDIQSKSAQHDPEALASGHRTFITALAYALLLTDVPYTKELRSLLGNIDQLIAFFNRLLDVQQKVDLERDSGAESEHTLEQERRTSIELDRARKKVDSDLKSVVNRLRQLDRERIGAARYLDLKVVEGDSFQAWKGGGVDRLLMKLEFGRMRDDGYDAV